MHMVRFENRNFLYYKYLSLLSLPLLSSSLVRQKEGSNHFLPLTEKKMEKMEK